MNLTILKQKFTDPIFKNHVILTTIYLIFSLLVLTVGVTTINDNTEPVLLITQKEKRAKEARETKQKATDEQKKIAEDRVAKVKPLLKITTLTEPKDNTVVELGDKVIVHYTGKLEDGTVFDSSLTRGEPFPLANIGSADVIQGWNAGIIGMKKTGKYNLFIPSEFAYGATGSGKAIKPNANLNFEIEILDIDKNANVYKL